jgi:hypothetical protein
MKKFNLTTEIRGALRLIFRKSPHRKAAMMAARVEIPCNGRKKPFVYYRCAACNNLVKPNNLNIDHILPVGPAPGTRNAPPDLSWEIFLEKMFCGLENLQCLCLDCHALKTKDERAKVLRKEKIRTKAVS